MTNTIEVYRDVVSRYNESVHGKTYIIDFHSLEETSRLAPEKEIRDIAKGEMERRREEWRKVTK